MPKCNFSTGFVFFDSYFLIILIVVSSHSATDFLQVSQFRKTISFSLAIVASSKWARLVAIRGSDWKPSGKRRFQFRLSFEFSALMRNKSHPARVSRFLISLCSTDSVRRNDFLFLFQIFLFQIWQFDYHNYHDALMMHRASIKLFVM